MELNQFFKSLVDNDDTAIVICDLSHTIIYMNPAAILNYANRGGANLLGQNLFNCHNPKSVEMINKVVDWFKKSADNNFIHTGFSEKHNRDVYMVALRDNEKNLIGYYEKHEFRNVDNSPIYGGIE